MIFTITVIIPSCFFYLCKHHLKFYRFMKYVLHMLGLFLVILLCLSNVFSLKHDEQNQYLTYLICQESMNQINNLLDMQTLLMPSLCKYVLTFHINVMFIFTDQLPHWALSAMKCLAYCKLNFYFSSIFMITCIKNLFF